MKEFFEFLKQLPPGWLEVGAGFAALYWLAALAAKVLGNERFFRTRHDRLKTIDAYLQEAGFNDDLALGAALREQRHTWTFFDVFGIRAAGERRAVLLALKAAAGPRLSWYQLKQADPHLQLTDRGFRVHFDWGDRLVYLAHGLMMVLGGSSALLAAVATIWLSFRSGTKPADTLRPSLTALLSAAGFLYATFSLGPALCALTARRVLPSLPAAGPAPVPTALLGSAAPPHPTPGVGGVDGLPDERPGHPPGADADPTRAAATALPSQSSGQPALGAAGVIG